MLGAYRAKVDWTAPEDGIDGAIRRAREMAGNDPARFCYVDQFSNDANWMAHYQTTGPEIGAQTAGQITHFVAGLGTTGTFMGAARHLKEQNPLLQAVSVLPDSPAHGIAGLKHKGDGIIPAIYNPHLANRIVEMETQAVYAMARWLAREEGLLVGISAAAAVAASREGRRRRSSGRTQRGHRGRASRCRGQISLRAILARNHRLRSKHRSTEFPKLASRN